MAEATFAFDDPADGSKRVLEPGWEEKRTRTPASQLHSSTASHVVCSDYPRIDPSRRRSLLR